jgi:hypothetical protein
VDLAFVWAMRMTRHEGKVRHKMKADTIIRAGEPEGETGPAFRWDREATPLHVRSFSFDATHAQDEERPREHISNFAPRSARR